MSQLTQEQTAAQTQSPRTYSMNMNYIGKAKTNGAEKRFYKDTIITGVPQPPVPNMGISARLLTTEGYYLPMGIVKEIPPIQLDSDKDMISQTKSIIETSAFKQGAFMGAAAGAAFSFFSNRNMFYTVLMGMVIGGAVGYFIKTNKDSK